MQIHRPSPAIAHALHFIFAQDFVAAVLIEGIRDFNNLILNLNLVLHRFNFKPALLYRPVYRPT